MNANPAIFTLLCVITALALFLSACAGSFSGQSTQSKGDGEAIPASPGSTLEPGTPAQSELPGGETSEPVGLRPTHTLPGLGTVEIAPSPPVAAEVPQDILDEIISDLVERSGALQGEIQVIKAEAVVWNDGALGCPLPGEFYIQMMIEGYQVVLEVEGVEYDYRVSGKGSFKLCEGENMPAMDPSGQSQNPLVDQVKEDLANRLGLPMTEIVLLKLEAVTWPDSGLGCPQPGMAYAQVLTPGFLIILSAENQAYEYHASKGTEVIYCANPEPPVPGESPDV